MNIRNADTYNYSNSEPYAPPKLKKKRIFEFENNTDTDNYLNSYMYPLPETKTISVFIST